MLGSLVRVILKQFSDLVLFLKMYHNNIECHIKSFFMNICPALISLSLCLPPSMLMSGTVSSSGRDRAGSDGTEYTASHWALSSGDGSE